LSIQLASLTADMFHFLLQLPQAFLFGGPRLRRQRRQRAGKRNESPRTANNKPCGEDEVVTYPDLP